MVDPVDNEEEEEEGNRQEDKEFKPEAEDSDSDGSDSGSSVSFTLTLSTNLKFDAAVLKQKEAEECWSSMQPKQQHRKLPTQKAKPVVKQEPVKKPAEGKGKHKKSEGDDEEEGRKRKPQVKRTPGEAFFQK